MKNDPPPSLKGVHAGRLDNNNNNNNLTDKIKNGYIHIFIICGIYGLPQFARLANMLSKEHIYDCFEVNHMLCHSSTTDGLFDSLC